MEEYEKFCEKSLTRIQEASLSTESFLPVQSENSSLIRFHGVAVLSPLVKVLWFLNSRFLYSEPQRQFTAKQKNKRL